MNGYCSYCGHQCRPILVDFGVGVTEAWGVRHNDVDIQKVSECCEAPINDFPPEVLESESEDAEV